MSLCQNSVNAQQPKIPYPWLVFNEKVKVNSVMLRDSTAVCDSMVLLFGGSISRGGLVIFLLLVVYFFLDIFCLFLCQSYSFLYLIGWTLENVRRVLRIFHETWFG